MKHPYIAIAALLLAGCSAARAAELVPILETIDVSPSGTWDYTGGTIVLNDADLPASLTRDAEVDTWFDGPSSNPAFDPVNWRYDLGLDSLAAAQATWGVNLLTPGEPLVWADLTGRPTTLAGYGIADAYTQSAADAAFASAAEGALAATALQPSTISPDFFRANGFDLGFYQLLAMGEPRVDYGVGKLFGSVGLLDERLDWESRVLSGSWTADSISATTLTVTDTITFPAGSIARPALDDDAVGPNQLDELGGYTAQSITLTSLLALEDRDTDPANPPVGGAVLWLSSGAGSGDPGDLMIKINSGGTTKTIILADFSAN